MFNYDPPDRYVELLHALGSAPPQSREPLLGTASPTADESSESPIDGGGEEELCRAEFCKKIPNTCYRHSLSFPLLGLNVGLHAFV